MKSGKRRNTSVYAAMKRPLWAQTKWSEIDCGVFNELLAMSFHEPRLLARELDIPEWQAKSILDIGLDVITYEWQRPVFLRLCGAMKINPCHLYRGIDLGACVFGSGGTVQRISLQKKRSQAELLEGLGDGAPVAKAQERYSRLLKKAA